MRVLGLALYGEMAASNRVRLGQYIDNLREEGISLQLQSLIDGPLLKSRLQNKQIRLADVFICYIRRFYFLIKNRDFDLIILHCELFPFLPGWIERLFLNRPYIYDFDDAFFLKYSTGKYAGFYKILSPKFPRVIAGATAVTAGNRFLADYARNHNQNVFLLPSVVDTKKLLPLNLSNRSFFTIGWIGTPSTAGYLRQVVEPLRRLGSLMQVRFVVVGGKAPKIYGVDVRELEWKDGFEAEVISTFDVGIMPIPDDDWARGKCAYKLIQYMSCGVPVVASRVGANIEVVTEDCGFLVDTPESWFDALLKLTDPDMRASFGLSARARALSNFSLDKNFPKLLEVITFASKCNRRNLRSE